MAIASKLYNHSTSELKVIKAVHCHNDPKHHYKMTAEIRGTCLIINNSEFKLTSCPNNNSYNERQCCNHHRNSDDSSVNNIDSDLNKNIDDDVNNNNNNNNNNDHKNVRQFFCNVNCQSIHHSELPQRPWSNDDAKNLANVFQQLGFIVHVENNLTASNMLHSFKYTAANRCKTEHEALFVIILSHGNENYLYGSDGRALNIHDMIDCFDNRHCKVMLGKPKVFLIQSVLYRRQRLAQPALFAPLPETRPIIPSFSDSLMIDHSETYLDYKQQLGIEPNLLIDQLDSCHPFQKKRKSLDHFPSCYSTSHTNHHHHHQNHKTNTKSTVTVPTTKSSDCSLAVKTDMLLCFCCLGLGHATSRDEVSGSFMSVALTYYLMTCAHNRDFLSILKMITREWAQRWQENGQAKTLELKCYGWTKFLFFNPGLVIDPNT